MDNLKLGLKVLAMFLVGFFGLIASNGSINYGSTNHEGLYVVCGIINFVIVAWADYSLYKLFFKKGKEPKE